MVGMRTSLSVLGLACAGFAACGGRIGGEDTSDVSGVAGGSGGASTTGGSSAAVASGGKSATYATGGSGGSRLSGGSGAALATGGKAVTYPTGGKSVTYATGGSSAALATGGKSAPNSGGSGTTGGKSAPNSGGSGTTGGKSATTATGGSSGLGSTGGSSATGGSGGTGGTTGTSVTPITSCNDTFPFLGTWAGNILDFYFEPQQALKLELYQDAAGTITGKLTWGDGTPPPPPQGADVPYPPGYWEQQTDMKYLTAAPDPWPGFAYTIVRGAGCDTTFRFGVSTDEIWQGWCALQTPIYSADLDSWGCALRGGGGSSDGTTCTVQPRSGASVTYPLWRCEACGALGFGGGVCACDQNACSANMTATQTFDLAYSVSDGTDILSGPDPSCSDCTVRLERQN